MLPMCPVHTLLWGSQSWLRVGFQPTLRGDHLRLQTTHPLQWFFRARYRSIPSSAATRTSVSTSRSTCFSVCAAVHEIRNKFCAAAGRSTGLM